MNDLVLYCTVVSHSMMYFMPFILSLRFFFFFLWFSHIFRFKWKIHHRAGWFVQGLHESPCGENGFRSQTAEEVWVTVVLWMTMMKMIMGFCAVEPKPLKNFSIRFQSMRTQILLWCLWLLSLNHLYIFHLSDESWMMPHTHRWPWTLKHTADRLVWTHCSLFWPISTDLTCKVSIHSALCYEFYERLLGFRDPSFDFFHANLTLSLGSI